MKRFAALYEALDATTRTARKLEALTTYLGAAPGPDRVWAIALLSGQRPRRAVSTGELRAWAAEEAGLPLWLIEACHATAGDLAETMALVLPAPRGGPDQGAEISLAAQMAEILSWAGQPAEARRAAVRAAWARLGARERFVFNKLLTGGFRVGVGAGLITRALAEITGREPADLAHSLAGDWRAEATTWAALIEAPMPGSARPYPFQLASPVAGAPGGGPEGLGPPPDWQAEWKWDGIRAQIIARAGTVALWSRGGELITAAFPELATPTLPPGTVFDGELLAWPPGAPAPLPFSALQKRLGRKRVPRALLDEAPARLLAYDLLEEGGQDLRALPLATRRARLEALLAPLPEAARIAPSPLVPFESWPALATARQEARARGAEGLMLKRGESPYRPGRRRGDWWKWKLDPFTIDAVMIYAQAGHGRRATLYTDYTLALWHEGALVPVAKAYSGLTDAEFRAVTAWVRRHTVQRFGPVRQVQPEQVFEIAFEGVQRSPRHKSGVALRFPRIARWRRDKPAAEADTLEALRALLPPA